MAIGGEERSFQCSLVPVDRVGDRYHAILLVLRDITELERAQRRHTALMRSLVETLMQVVDLHDPHSANHSSRMVEVANAGSGAAWPRCRPRKPNPWGNREHFRCAWARHGDRASRAGPSRLGA